MKKKFGMIEPTNQLLNKYVYYNEVLQLNRKPTILQMQIDIN